MIISLKRRKHLRKAVNNMIIVTLISSVWQYRYVIATSWFVDVSCGKITTQSWHFVKSFKHCGKTNDVMQKQICELAQQAFSKNNSLIACPCGAKFCFKQWLKSQGLRGVFRGRRERRKRRRGDAKMDKKLQKKIRALPIYSVTQSIGSPKEMRKML